MDKVEFTSDQQERVQALIDSAYKRAYEKATSCCDCKEKLERSERVQGELLEVCKLIDTYYSASLDNQPPYVLLARIAIKEAEKGE